MKQKNEAQAKFAEEYKNFGMTAERLKPCPKCGDERVKVYITCDTEPNVRDLLDTSVKCSACGYEYIIGQIQDSSSWALSKCRNIAVKAWNALSRPSISLESEAN